MSALRAQNKLAMAAWQGMKDSYAANEEVAAVRAQLAAIPRGSLPPDVATAATALDTKLATFGGAWSAADAAAVGEAEVGGGPARCPAACCRSMRSTRRFNTVLAPLSQNGIDMPPTKAEVDTWESGCKGFTATVNAWKTMLDVDLVGFNSLLRRTT
jgi:hypothetical protein